jgi:hypothetical protein
MCGSRRILIGMIALIDVLLSHTSCLVLPFVCLCTFVLFSLYAHAYFKILLLSVV